MWILSNSLYVQRSSSHAALALRSPSYLNETSRHFKFGFHAFKPRPADEVGVYSIAPLKPSLDALDAKEVGDILRASHCPHCCILQTLRAASARALKGTKAQRHNADLTAMCWARLSATCTEPLQRLRCPINVFQEQSQTNPSICTWTSHWFSNAIPVPENHIHQNAGTACFFDAKLWLCYALLLA